MKKNIERFSCNVEYFSPLKFKTVKENLFGSTKLVNAAENWFMAYVPKIMCNYVCIKKIIYFLGL